MASISLKNLLRTYNMNQTKKRVDCALTESDIHLPGWNPKEEKAFFASIKMHGLKKLKKLQRHIGSKSQEDVRNAIDLYKKEARKRDLAHELERQIEVRDVNSDEYRTWVYMTSLANGSRDEQLPMAVLETLSEQTSVSVRPRPSPPTATSAPTSPSPPTAPARATAPSKTTTLAMAAAPAQNSIPALALAPAQVTAQIPVAAPSPAPATAPALDLVRTNNMNQTKKRVDCALAESDIHLPGWNPQEKKGFLKGIKMHGFKKPKKLKRLISYKSQAINRRKKEARSRELKHDLERYMASLANRSPVEQLPMAVLETLSEQTSVSVRPRPSPPTAPSAPTSPSPPTAPARATAPSKTMTPANTTTPAKAVAPAQNSIPALALAPAQVTAQIPVAAPSPAPATAPALDLVRTNNMNQTKKRVDCALAESDIHLPGWNPQEKKGFLKGIKMHGFKKPKKLKRLISYKSQAINRRKKEARSRELKHDLERQIEECGATSVDYKTCVSMASLANLSPDEQLPMAVLEALSEQTSVSVRPRPSPPTVPSPGKKATPAPAKARAKATTLARATAPAKTTTPAKAAAPAQATAQILVSVPATAPTLALSPAPNTKARNTIPALAMAPAQATAQNLTEDSYPAWVKSSTWATLELSFPNWRHAEIKDFLATVNLGPIIDTVAPHIPTKTALEIAAATNAYNIICQKQKHAIMMNQDVPTLDDLKPGYIYLQCAVAIKEKHRKVKKFRKPSHVDRDMAKAQFVLKRWLMPNVGHLRKGWTANEKYLLIVAVEKYGQFDIASIQSHFPKKDSNELISTIKAILTEAVNEEYDYEKPFEKIFLSMITWGCTYLQCKEDEHRFIAAKRLIFALMELSKPEIMKEHCSRILLLIDMLRRFIDRVRQHSNPCNTDYLELNMSLLLFEYDI